MKPKELDEQFKELEGDKQVQAAEAGTPPPAARKKRITVAELNKAMDELTEIIDTDIYSWLDKLDTRVRHFENAEAEKIDTLPESVIRRFERLEDFIGNSTVKEITELKARLDALEGAIGALADAFRQHLEEVSGEQPAAAQEIEFATPPEPLAAVSTRPGNIEAVASVCLTMNDVLLVARALRDSQDINEMDRNEILNTACRTAGVEPTHGLQIRAGIHDTR